MFRSVQTVVEYGLAHRDLTGIKAIGVDEVAYSKGYRYATLVYQLDPDQAWVAWSSKTTNEKMPSLQ